MTREKILLSDVEVMILRYLKKSKETVYIKKIMDDFGFDSKGIVRHMNRLRKQHLIQETKMLPFKQVEINKLGLSVLNLFTNLS